MPLARVRRQSVKERAGLAFLALAACAAPSSALLLPVCPGRAVQLSRPAARGNGLGRRDAGASDISEGADARGPDGLARAVFGGGCFWCTEAVFKKIDGVRGVVSGYAGGVTENPTYRDVCSGRTGHAEVIGVKYEPSEVTYEELLGVFWDSHDPTQGNRQGMDVGPMYRSIILYTNEAQREAAERSREKAQAKVNANAVLGRLVGAVLRKEGGNFADITTEIAPLNGAFCPAEEVHQDFYQKNPLMPYMLMNAEPKIAKATPKIAKINQKIKQSKDTDLGSH